MEPSLQPDRLDYFREQLVNVLRHPNANLRAAFVLAAIVVVIILLLTALIVLLVNRFSRKDDRRDDEELELYMAILALSGGESSEEGESGESDAVPEPAPRPVVVLPPEEPRNKLLWWGGSLLVAIVVVLAVGITSASSAVCMACHEANPHIQVVESGGTDPHLDTACVRCHEGSGLLGNVTIEVPERLLHVALGYATQKRLAPYGYVMSSGCLNCHRSVLSRVTEDEDRGIRMAHEHPAEAGAKCLDCHDSSLGVITTLTTGMTPCLRCHDGRNQSTACDLCHTKDTSAAGRSRTNPATMVGRSLVPTPDCGACHKQETQCDPCHGGQRMPHTELFMWWGHARQGVEDIWYTNGAKCGRCHTPERRPCTKCHAFFPGHPVRYFAQGHTKAASGDACDGCHGQRAYVAGRDFCELCHGGTKITQ